jgi:Holliday junction resolvasome RuvABC endonuclease subunit
MATENNTPNLDRIDELTQRAIYAASDLRSTLQFRADDVVAVEGALRKFNAASSALTAYANGVLDAHIAVAS